MSFWWNKRETRSPYEVADALYNSAVALSHDPERAQDAERTLAAAIGEYRKLVHHMNGVEAKRRLAKALCRDAIFTAMVLGRHQNALAPGCESIKLGRDVLDAVRTSHAAFDAIVQEVSAAMNDVAQVYFVAGRPRERERLLLEAAEVARRSSGLGGRQALGTALHNLAEHWLRALRSHVHPGAGTRHARLSSILLTERAFEIRLALCEDSRAQPYFAWELASSSLQLGQVLLELSHGTNAAQVLRTGIAGLRNVTGPTVEPLRNALAVALTSTGQQPLFEDDGVRDRMNALTPGASVLLELLGLLEADDRIAMLTALWFPDAWRLRAGSAPIPSFESALAELTACGLITQRPCQGSSHHFEIDYIVERRARALVCDADAERFCLAVAHRWAQKFAGDCKSATANPVHSGIAAAVYACRAGAFKMSLDILEHEVLGLACRRGESAPVLIHMQVSAELSHDRASVERVDRATERLAGAHMIEGRGEHALETAALGLDFAIRGELGAARVLRFRELQLALLYRLERHDEVLARFAAMLPEFEAASGNDTELQRLREAVQHHAVGSAKALQRWQLALDLNRSIVKSLESRGASASEIAAQRIGDYCGLLELGDSDAADSLLRECQAVLEHHAHDVALANAVGARGIVASRRGDTSSAVSLKRRSLAISYRAASPLSETAHSHDIYANEIVRIDQTPECAGLHWLTAAVLHVLGGNPTAATIVLRKIMDFRRTAALQIPSSVEALIQGMVQEGLPLDRVLETQHDRAHAVIAEILERARI